MNQISTISVGHALRRIRVAQGLTQRDVAQRLGVPQAFVSKLEKGIRSFYLLEVFSYAPALGLTAEELFWLLNRILITSMDVREEA